jgi:hypothetical protein
MDGARASVLNHVGERLLHDAVHRDFDPGRQVAGALKPATCLPRPRPAASIGCSREVNGPDSTTSVDSAPVRLAASSAHSGTANANTTPGHRQQQVHDHVAPAPPGPVAVAGQQQRRHHRARDYRGQHHTHPERQVAALIQGHPQQHRAQPVGERPQGLRRQDQPVPEQHRLERAVPAVMRQVRAAHVKRRRVRRDLIRVIHEHEHRPRINRPADQPRTPPGPHDSPPASPTSPRHPLSRQRLHRPAPARARPGESNHAGRSAATGPPSGPSPGHPPQQRRRRKQPAPGTPRRSHQPCAAPAPAPGSPR